ncbi:hypothetical protein QJQ45_005604 [Haematococcus lacustris]|nr:hypothetical protein QJQ45_005604 [Haematococcus lacustris]
MSACEEPEQEGLAVEGNGLGPPHSKHVHAVAVDEAEELYLSLSQRTNEQHVLLVLYSPTCPHCQTIEGEVEKLATGLAHEPSLSICALSADSAAARYFAKEVLGLTATPSYVLFPKGSRTFFKYKGRGRDSSSLLKFLNMVCNQNEDHMWQLATPSDLAGSASAHKAVQHLSVAPAPEASLLGNPLPATTSLNKSQVLFASLSIAVAATALLVKVLRARSAAATAEAVMSVASPAPPPPGMVVAMRPLPMPAPSPPQAAVQTSGEPVTLVSEVDALLARVSILLLKLIKTRISLTGSAAATLPLVDPGSSTLALPPAEGSAGMAGSQATPPGSSAPNLAASGRGAGRGGKQSSAALPASAASITATALWGSGTGAPTAEPQPSNLPAQLQSQQLQRLNELQRQELEVLQGSDAARSTQLPGQGSESLVTGEAISLTRPLSADELLGLLEEEGADVGKVLERLMSGSGSLEHGKQQLLAVEKLLTGPLSTS